MHTYDRPEPVSFALRLLAALITLLGFGLDNSSDEPVKSAMEVRLVSEQ